MINEPGKFITVGTIFVNDLIFLQKAISNISLFNFLTFGGTWSLSLSEIQRITLSGRTVWVRIEFNVNGKEAKRAERQQRRDGGQQEDAPTPETSPPSVDQSGIGPPAD